MVGDSIGQCSNVNENGKEEVNTNGTNVAGEIDEGLDKSNQGAVNGNARVRNYNERSRYECVGEEGDEEDNGNNGDEY